MAALPEMPEDLSAPIGGERVSTPALDESGDVNMGGVPADPKASANTVGKKKKKGKK